MKFVKRFKLFLERISITNNTLIKGFTINDNVIVSKILDALDVYTFYEDEKWMFVDMVSLFPKDLIGIISIDEFFEIGKKISDELNKDNVSIKVYDIEIMKTYFNKITKQ